MRKVIFLMHVSLDGLVAGPNGEMDWIVHTGAVADDAYSLHATTDAAIYGRVTYEMMAGYWPNVLDDPNASEGEQNHARWTETATKYVFSRTLDHVDWKGSVIVRDNIAEEMAKIKAQPGKDIWFLGSPSLAQEFMKLGLIDEYRINVNPIILGSGKPLFADLDDKLNLKLIEARAMNDGVVALRYVPDSTS